MAVEPRPAVFLDKDGTLIENVSYNVDRRKIRLMPGAGEALRILQEAGYRLVVVTNQSGVAKGYFTEDELLAAWEALRETLRGHGVALDAFYYCPHPADDELPPGALPCTCRKPLPGLLQRAAAELGLGLSRSWLIGDILDDVEAGRRAGCRTVLVGPERYQLDGAPAEQRQPHWTAAGIKEACRIILREDAPAGAALAGLRGERQQ